MTRPFFSICIAAYNAQRYIGECLDSIAAQDCRDFEVVIVDDGSVVPLTLDEGMRASFPSCMLKRTANGGPYAARQAAFDIATGEVVLCVDADDGLRDPAALSKPAPTSCSSTRAHQSVCPRACSTSPLSPRVASLRRDWSGIYTPKAIR